MEILEIRDKTVIVEIDGKFFEKVILKEGEQTIFATPDDRPIVTSSLGLNGKPQTTTRTPNKDGGVDIKIE